MTQSFQCIRGPMTAVSVDGSVFNAPSIPLVVSDPGITATPLGFAASASTDTFMVYSDCSGDTIVTQTTTSGTYVTEKPTADILSLSITGAAAQVSIDFTNGDPLPLSGIYSNAKIIELDGPHGSDQLVTTSTGAYLGSDEIRYPAGTQLTDNLTSSGGVIAIAGTTNLSDPAADSVTVAPGAYLTLNGSQTLASLEIQSGGTIRVINANLQPGPEVLTVGSLILDNPDTNGDGGGILDLGSDDLIVRQEDLAGIFYLLSAGYDGGLWDGQGSFEGPIGPRPAAIISSAAASDVTGESTLGYAEVGNGPGDLAMAAFDGQAVYSGDVVVKLTVYGDANLDGTADSTDQASLINGLNNQLTGWTSGDFNHDGVINVTDDATFEVYDGLAGASPDIASKKYAIKAQATNIYAYGPWTYTNQTCGTTILATTGSGPTTIETRNVRAWFARPYVRLFESSNSSGGVVWNWGTVGYQIGYKDSTGASTQDHCEVVAISLGGVSIKTPYPGVKLPVPGLQLPTLPVAGFAPNWQGYNSAGDPNVQGVSVPSSSPTGVPVGTPDYNPALPTPSIPPPPAGFK